MADREATLQAFRQYAQLIHESISFSPDSNRSESPTSLGVERGMVFVLALASRETPAALVDPLMESTRRGGLDRVAVVDAAGHHRPVYRPILIYSLLQAF